MQAVLMDLRPGGGVAPRTLSPSTGAETSFQSLAEWRERRRRYIQLYQRKLGRLKGTPSSAALQQVPKIQGVKSCTEPGMCYSVRVRKSSRVRQQGRGYLHCLAAEE